MAGGRRLNPLPLSTSRALPDCGRRRQTSEFSLPSPRPLRLSLAAATISLAAMVIAFAIPSLPFGLFLAIAGVGVLFLAFINPINYALSMWTIPPTFRYGQKCSFVRRWHGCIVFGGQEHRLLMNLVTKKNFNLGQGQFLQLEPDHP